MMSAGGQSVTSANVLDNGLTDSCTSSVTSKKNHKIISKLKERFFPDLSRCDMDVYMSEVRASRGGKLSGMTVHEIANEIKALIDTKGKLVSSSNLTASSYTHTCPGVSLLDSGSVFSRLAAGQGHSHGHPLVTLSGVNDFGSQDNEELDEDDMCVICHEELASQKTSTLDCGHTYHIECIRKWFKEQSTCPTCRNHALLPDEFPALGGTGKGTGSIRAGIKAKPRKV